MNRGAMEKIDYSPFLHVFENGDIWWRLDDAIKLGAGYLPICDDERNLVPVLRAKNNRICVNERTLFVGFNREHQASPHPWLLKRDDGRYVEAHEFLKWLSGYVAQRRTTILFPDDLDSAVRVATAAPVERSLTSQSFESLVAALEGWFDRPLAELPEVLRQRVERDFFPMLWDILPPDQRRSAAQHSDYQNDPATEQDRERWYDFFVRMRALKKQIEEWEAVATPTASDLAQKELRLGELEKELARMDRQWKLADRPNSSLEELDAAMLHQPVDAATTADNRYTPNNAKREARKLDTQAMHERWQKAYRDLKKQRRNMPDTWYAQQIAKQDIAAGRKGGTIRKQMTK